MPNWCANSLKLTATTDEHRTLIARIVEAVEQSEGTNESPRIFNILKPMPEELRDTVAGYLGDTEEQAKNQAKCAACQVKYGYKDWYDWSLGEWGTKWDASDVFAVKAKDTLFLNFDTAWSPPIELYKTLEQMGFKVQAGFVEQGVSYIGYYADGVDHTEDIPHEGDIDEDDYSDPFELSEFFQKNYGFDHAPSHFGG